MINILNTIPRQVYLAYSGGVDSTAILDFLTKNHFVKLIHINHGNEISAAEQDFVTAKAKEYQVPLNVYDIDPKIPKGRSKEEYWRTCRYDVFNSINGLVITGHTLDDAVETYIWNMLNGNYKTISYQNRNVIRPFLTTRKNKLVDWCQRKQLTWFEDPTNADKYFATRNYIRHELLPKMLEVQPGLHTVVRKMIEAENSVPNLEK